MGSEDPDQRPQEAAISRRVARVAATIPATTPSVADTRMARKASFQGEGKALARAASPPAAGLDGKCRGRPRPRDADRRRTGPERAGSGRIPAGSGSAPSSEASSPARINAGSPGTTWRSPERDEADPDSGPERAGGSGENVDGHGDPAAGYFSFQLLGMITSARAADSPPVHLLRRATIKFGEMRKMDRRVLDDDLLRLAQAPSRVCSLVPSWPCRWRRPAPSRRRTRGCRPWAHR